LQHHPHALFLAFCAALFAMAPAGLAQPTIDFSKSTNLKAVYDAGLRPWRFRPDETHSLELTNQRISVIAPGANVFTIDVEHGSFEVGEGHELRRVNITSQPMSPTEAAAKAREICQALKIDMTQGAGMGGLEEKIAEFAKLGNQTPAPQYWNGGSKVNGLRYSMTLHPIFGFNKILGNVSVLLNFEQPNKRMKPRTEPIKPPPGYEHLSLDRPESTNTKPVPNPAYDPKYIAKMTAEMKPAAAPKPAASPVNGRLDAQALALIFGYPADQLVITDATEVERQLYSIPTLPTIPPEDIYAAYRITGKTPATFFPLMITIAKQGTYLAEEHTDYMKMLDSLPPAEKAKLKSGDLGPMTIEGLGAGGVRFGPMRTAPSANSAHPLGNSALIAELRMPEQKVDVRIAMSAVHDGKPGANLIKVPGGESYHAHFGQNRSAGQSFMPEAPKFDWAKGYQALFAEVYRVVTAKK
jgi:hypothetical protein